MFPLACFLMGLGPRQPQDVGKEALGQSVPADHDLGEVHALLGERNLTAGFDQALGLEPLHHLAHGRARHLHSFCDSGLDDVEIVFAEFVDRLAVLFERRVPFR